MRIPLFVEDPKAKHLFDLKEQIKNLKEGDTHPFAHLSKELAEKYAEALKRVFHANIFTVDKSEKCTEEKVPDCPYAAIEHYLQRIVVDGRIANAHLQNPAFMEIFTLEVLFDFFARCKAKIEQKLTGNAKKTNHCILALSADLRHWFHQIPMPEKYRSAYALDLGYQEGRRRSLGIDWPEDKLEFDVYLPWLPLKCGGGVFVLIDNIFHPHD
jgi:hypothetical protein